MKDTITTSEIQVNPCLSNISHDELDYFDRRLLTLVIQAINPGKFTRINNKEFSVKMGNGFVDKKQVGNLMYRLNKLRYITIKYHISVYGDTAYKYRKIYLSEKTLNLLRNEKN